MGSFVSVISAHCEVARFQDCRIIETGTSTLLRGEFRVAGSSSAIAFARYRATRRFGSLDGWRALAIVAVIWHHTMATRFASPIAAEGRHGVTLFFAISGFLIVTLLLREREREGSISLGRFWGRRALRILPIYYATLLLYVVLVHVTDHSEAGTDFFRNLPFFATFTTNWYVVEQEHRIFYFSWSLAAEEQFYLVWPVVEIMLRRTSHKLILLGGLMIASQIALAIHQITGHAGALPFRMLYNIPLGILLGTTLAHLLHEEKTFRILHGALGQVGSALTCLFIAILAIAVSPGIGIEGELLITVALALLVAVTVIREDNDLAPLLRWRPVVWVGTVSYGMYMLHMLAVNVVRRGSTALNLDAPGLIFVTSVALACALATLSFIGFERPFLRLKDRKLRH